MRKKSSSSERPTPGPFSWGGAVCRHEFVCEAFEGDKEAEDTFEEDDKERKENSKGE